MSSLPGAQRALHHRERWPRDWYVEPDWTIEALFHSVPFVGPIHDPACGGGTIPTVARQWGFIATGSDIADRGFGHRGVDFLSDDTPRRNILCNPPYLLAEKFILHALDVANSKIAVIVRLNFLAGQVRCRLLFLPHPPARVVILGKRPSMPPGGTDIEAKGGTTDYCWLVWDRGHHGPSIIQFWAPPSKSGTGMGKLAKDGHPTAPAITTTRLSTLSAALTGGKAA